MGTFTTQISFGAFQYERLQKWMAKESHPADKPDSFVKEKFMELLNKKVPE